MTTATRALPAHGTTARYQGTPSGSRPPCGCKLCVAAHTKACAARELAHLQGILLRVPTGPVSAHVHWLLGAGMSRTQIAIAADVSTATVCNAVKRKTPTLNATTAAKILGVRPRIVRDTDQLPVIGTQRRLRALYAIGHGSGMLSKTSGVSDATIRNIVHGRLGFVTAATYKAVRAAYWQLSGRPGSSRLAVASARRHGWPGVDYWDADEIDNPAFIPATTQTPRYVALAENCLELQRQGYTRTQAAGRLGVEKSYLEHSIARWREAQAKTQAEDAEVSAA